MISSHSEYRRSDYYFARQHTGPAPEPTAPLVPMWRTIANVAGWIAFMAASVLITQL
jgi:hypothetical protein